MTKRDLQLQSIAPGDGFVGLIVPGPTGIVYQHEAGGTMMSHPALEGWFWPMSWKCHGLGDHESRALVNLECEAYSDRYRKDINAALDAWLLDLVFEAPTHEDVREQLWPHSYKSVLGLQLQPTYTLFGEAWVPVKVRGGWGNARMGGIPPRDHIGRCMILVYPNSD